MAPYHAIHRERVVTEGPAVVLLPATAQAVALALHELATNAAKYGALSTETGTLTGHLDDRRRRPDARLDRDRRSADGRAGARWASASPSCAPASRRSSAAASATTGGPKACAAVSPSRPPRSPPRPAPRKHPPRRRPTIGRARSLAGMRLLVVEDELLVSMLLEEHPERPRRRGRRPLRRGWPMAWRPPRPSASTAPSSISISPASRPSRWPISCWRAACRSCSSPAISATASTGATPTCRCCPSRSMPRRSKACCSPCWAASR